MKLHEKISFYRKRCCLSQEALAEKIGVSRQAVSKWETGDALPEITKLKSLAELFGVTVDFLLSEEDEFSPPQAQAQPPYSEHNSRSTNVLDRFDDWLEALPDKIMPYIKKYGWIGGIVLIIIGAYNTVVSLVGCAISLFGSASFSTIGMGFVGIPVLLSSMASAAVGIAMIAGGVIVIKKFKPKKVK